MARGIFVSRGERDGDVLAFYDIPQARHDGIAHFGQVGLRFHAENETVVDGEIGVGGRADERRRLGQHAGRGAHEVNHHFFHAVRGIVVAEAHFDHLGAQRGRAREVGEGSFVEFDVGNDLQLAGRCFDVDRAPVDLDDPSAHVADLDPVAHVERALGKQHEPRDDVAERFLQGEADDDGSEAERGERGGYFVAPDLRVNDHRADGNEQGTHEVAEKFGHALAQRTGTTAAEDEVIDHPKQGVEQQDPERRLDEAGAGAALRQLEDEADKNKQRRGRNDEIAQVAHGALDGQTAPAA